MQRTFNKLAWALVVALGLAVLATLVGVINAGPLDPPAGPAPTDRRQISSIPVTITVSGSYVVTADLTQAAPGDAIAVDANNVTIDFNGFRLESAGGSAGIALIGAQGNVVVRNGTILGRGAFGIDFIVCDRCLVENMQVLANGSGGVRLGSNSIVRNTNSSANTGHGIVIAGAGSVNNVVLNNVTNSNSGAGVSGIVVFSDRNRIEGNTALSNADRGIFILGSDNVVVKNTAKGNPTAQFDNAGAGTSFGPIQSDAGLTNPWANIDQ